MYRLIIPLLLLFTVTSSAQTTDDLINAIATVESNNNPLAYNSSEDAIGILQIRPIMVREINNICNKCNFKHSDARSVIKSRNMFKIWYHINDFRSFEIAARNWNGGYSGYKKSSTLNYWLRVKKHIKYN